MRFELDASVRRRDAGRLLVGGVPPRLMRLSTAGAEALDAALAGADLDPGAAALAARLVDAGLLHPLPADREDGLEATAIVPALDGGEPLVALVRVLAAEGPVIVVDDGSGDGSPARAAEAGATVIPNAGHRGPAGARNTGLRAARTELVAFLDADCAVEPGWRTGLAGLLAADERLGLVAPRVRSAAEDSAIGRYERFAGPLDLGPAASLVGPERRVSYLPAAALVGRRETLLEVGGFDETMRYGEDVDLVWRLAAAGRAARYVPSREVAHLPRTTVGDLARQRAGYGSSAPVLARRHGALAAPLRSGPHATAIWAAGAALGPRALLAGAIASAAIVAGRGKDRDSRLALAAVGLRGNLHATRHLARAMVREWLPLTLLAAAGNRRARRAALAAAVIDTAPVWRRSRRPADVIQLTVLHAVDRASYSFGLWREMARRRDLRAAIPATTRDRRGPSRR
jgi:mycofactocin system glycosyltransferase